jgi:hypothetical protein
MAPKSPKKTGSSQLRAFRKAARELGADESEARFDTALKTVAKHKPIDDPMPTDDPEALIEWGKRNIKND